MKIKLLFCFLLFILSDCIISAQPTEPILSIETGMHNSLANRISTDTAGKYLLTCSDDKTARLWDANTGTLLQTYRIPIGSEHEGMINSCALSPDSKIIAVGGCLGRTWDSTQSIYILNTQTGVVIKRLKNINNIINDIKFSPDGRWLTAAINMKNGIGVYIFDTKNWHQYKILNGYGANVFNTAFSAECLFATVCYDGKVRMYDKNFELIKQIDSLHGKKPCSIAFTPSGNMFAICFGDINTIEIRNTRNLSIAYLQGINTLYNPEEKYATISFGKDGKAMYGGGEFIKKIDDKNKYCIKIWNELEKDIVYDIPIMQNSIRDIKPLPNGNIAILGALPEIAVINNFGATQWYKNSKLLDFSDNDVSHFRINNNGLEIGFTPEYKLPMRFNITTRKLTFEQAIFSSPTDSSEDIKVTDWSGSENPKVNDSKISFLHPNEICFSTDINNTGNKIVFGTNWYLYLSNRNGEKIWNVELPAIAYAVNIADNEKLVCAALSDGTIRWYSMENGKELLAFFLNSDSKRWVLFTPKGFYDASAGAEELLGWHINHGPDSAATFYPISRFRDKYYRPDIIDEIFTTYNEDSAIEKANQFADNKLRGNKREERDVKEILPPIVTIITPKSDIEVDSNVININYSILTPTNAPVKNVKVLINGRPIQNKREPKIISSNDNILHLTLADTNNIITILAENKNGLSVGATLNVKYKSKNIIINKKILKPKLNILAIGISDYNDINFKLNYAAKDAQSFKDVLLTQKGKTYKEVVVNELLDKEATRENIIESLSWLKNNTSQDDIAMIFYAGHGMNFDRNFYILPVGADISNNKYMTTCISSGTFSEIVSTIVGKVIIFIDACHSGNLKNLGSNYVDINEIINKMTNKENGVVIFSSSTARENSAEDEYLEHGVYTKVLLDGFAGGAAIYDNEITVNSLNYFISHEFKKQKNNSQTPSSYIPNIPDFIIGTKN